MSNDTNDNSVYTSISTYRAHIIQSLRYSYSQQGHIFAPNPHSKEEENRQRSTLDEYMRRLWQLPLGAALLQVEVQGNRAIDEAISDGRVYQMEGVWATKVQTETFSYYTLDPSASGQKEWLPFFLDETYETRSGPRQKTNQKALNLAFKKPIEGEVVEEVDARFQRWLNPVLDLFRHHWECRETIEGQMVLSLYFEYSSNIQKLIQQYPGEERQNLRAEKIEALMDQLLLDIEEVRLTAPQRRYTSKEIILAVRRAIQNFCVDSNRRLLQLLGTKKKVSMFLEGHPAPVVVYHTNRNSEDWRSPALTTAELVPVAERCFLMLAESDQARSKSRMDEKASDTYAPVSHAETTRARESAVHLQQLEEDPTEALPFGLSFNPTEEVEEVNELAHLTITDVLVGKGAVKQEFTLADLKRSTYVAVAVAQEGIQVIHRWAVLAEATDSFRKTQSGTPPEQIEKLRTKVKLLFDPTGELGGEGSTRLLRTLSRVHLDSIQQQGDQYWCPWVVVQQQEDGGVSVQQRFVQAAEAALYLKHQIEQLKLNFRGKPNQFKAEASRLKAVHDPEGTLGATDSTCPIKRVQDDIAKQISIGQYQIKRGAVIISIPGLDDDTSRQVQDTLAADLIAKKRQAQQPADQVGAAS